jgi:membrane protease YdiL (CAAX protease family)
MWITPDFLIAAPAAAPSGAGPAGAAAEPLAAAESLYVLLFLFGLWINARLIWRGLRRPDPWRLGARRIEWRPWDGASARPILAFLLLMFLCSQLLIAWVRFGVGGPVSASMGPALVIQGLLIHGLGLVFLVHTVRRRKLRWADAFGLRRGENIHSVALGLAGYVAMVPAVVAGSIVFLLVLRWVNFPVEMQDVARALSETQPWARRVYSWVFAVVIAPVFEELLFRGVGLPSLARRIGLGRAVVLVSVIFALIHGHVPSLVPLFIVAVMLSLAYIYTGNILVPMVMHALFNGINIGLLTYVAGQS